MQLLCKTALLVVLGSCASVYTKHSVGFRQEGLPEMQITKILVVVLAGDTANSTRRLIENKFVTALGNIGYEGLSYLESFGQGGLANLSPEISFQKICDQEVDGILPIVLADRANEKKLKLRNKNDYQGLYYFERILNYSKLQVGYDEEYITSASKRFYWEAVLYSLHTLRPKYVVQVRSLSGSSSPVIAEQLTQIIIRDMLKHKVLAKKEPVVKQANKAAF